VLEGVRREQFDSDFAYELFLRKVATAPISPNDKCETYSPIQYDTFSNVPNTPDAAKRSPLETWMARARSGDLTFLGEVESLSPGLNVQRLLATNVVTVRILRRYGSADTADGERVLFMTNSGRLDVNGKTLCVRDEGETTFVPGQRIVMTGYRALGVQQLVATDPVRSVLLVSPEDEVSPSRQPSQAISLKALEAMIGSALENER
jgi:hypothetical protein